jgi:hypothetical protein
MRATVSLLIYYHAPRLKVATLLLLVLARHQEQERGKQTPSYRIIEGGVAFPIGSNYAELI